MCILHLSSFVCSSTEKVSVKCNQTGKVFKVKVASLSRVDDGNMSADDLAEGSQLLMNMNRKEYPVTVLKDRSTLKEALKEVQLSNAVILFKIKHECMFGVQVLRKGLNNQGLRSDRQQLMDHSRSKKSKTNSDDLLLAKAQVLY